MSVDIVFFKQKTAYEMRISDCSSDVCSSDLLAFVPLQSSYSLTRKVGGTERLPKSSSACAKGWLRSPLRPLPLLHLPTASARTTPSTPSSRRSEERRVGIAWVSTCRYWRPPNH